MNLDKLEQLAALRAEGTITEAEFQKAKAEILKANPSQEKAKEDRIVVEDKHTLYTGLMHFSQLSVILFPVLGMFIPLVMWFLRKGQSRHIDLHGRIILNWMIGFYLYLMMVSGVLYFTGTITSFSTDLLIDVIFEIKTVLVLLGIFLIFPLFIGFTFPIIGGLKALNGKAWKYPLSIKFLNLDLLPGEE